MTSEAPRRWRSFAFVSATVPDVLPLYRFFHTEFGDDTPSEERMASWIRMCPSAFTLAVKSAELDLSSDERAIVGAYKSLPITLAAVAQLEQGRVSGSRFESQHIASNTTDVAAVYLGDVYSPDLLLRGGLREDLIKETVQAIGERITPVYARPFTNKGWKAMRRHGFIQVNNGSDELELRALCKLADGRRLIDVLSRS